MREKQVKNTLGTFDRREKLNSLSLTEKNLVSASFNYKLNQTQIKGKTSVRRGERERERERENSSSLDFVCVENDTQPFRPHPHPFLLVTDLN